MPGETPQKLSEIENEATDLNSGFVVGVQDVADVPTSTRFPLSLWSAVTDALAALISGKASAVHTHAIADTTGLQTALNGKAATSHTHAQSEVTGLTASMALKADLVDGVIPSSQMPAISITTFLGTAANEAAMLAFVGQSGDWCNRTDTGKAYVLVAEPSSTLGNWAAINYPAAPVLSVNGLAGAVTLGKADIGLANVDDTSDTNKPVSTATATALAGKVATSLTVSGTKSIAGGGALSANRTVELVNDEATPGANKVYGTNGSGVKGWKADPSGGGGGSTHIGGSGALQGYTSAPVAAAYPPSLDITFAAFLTHNSGNIVITRNGVDLTIYLGDADPNTTPWIDTTALVTGSDLAAAFAAVVDAEFAGGTSTGVGGESVSINHTTAAAASTLAKSTAFADVAAESGGGAGTDFVAGSGHVAEVTLIAQNGTDTLRALRCGLRAGDLPSEIMLALRVGGTDYPLSGVALVGVAAAEFVIGDYDAEYTTGRASAALVAKISGSIPTGGSVVCWASGTRTT